MLQALIDKSQEHVTGTVRLKLYKGSVQTVGRWSDHSLYSEKHVTFEDDAGAYDQKDAAGFIKLALNAAVGDGALHTSSHAKAQDIFIAVALWRVPARLRGVRAAGLGVSVADGDHGGIRPRRSGVYRNAAPALSA
jgi:hypothetical protein